MIFSLNHKKMSDEDLMQKSANGDHRAFAKLYDRYGKKMHAYFYKMLWNDAEKAKDFTQDLFGKIIEKPHLFDQNKKFSSWIYSIAGNMCKNEYRSAEVRTRAGKELIYTADGTSFNKENTDMNFFKDDLDKALDLLNEDQRIVFIMKYKQGFKTKEIAECMDCSEGTVKSRLFYALKILSKELSMYNPKSEL